MTPVLSQGAEEYLSWLTVERGRATNTLSAYRRDLSAYESGLAERGLVPVAAAPGDIEAHLARLRREGRSAASVARAASALRGLHRFLLDERHAAADPSADVDPGRVPVRLPKAMREDQVLALIEAVAGTGPRDRRDRALIELLYATGARISELVALDLTDVADLAHLAHSADSADGADPPAAPGVLPAALLRLYGKGAKERLVPVGRPAAAALAAWLGPEGVP